MPVFVQLETDPFESARTVALAADASNRESRKARRPTRGIEIKEEVPAILRVLRYDGTEIGLVDAGALNGQGVSTAGYSNFLLQSVQESRLEKHQIVETFGASYIFFFGEAPRLLDVQVIVINSLDFNWEAEWWENYENNFRGTKLVEQGARLYMFYDDNIVEGYMLACQGVKVADQPLAVQLSFKMFVTSYRNVTMNVYSGDYPIRKGASVMPIETTNPNRSGSAVVNKTGQAAEEAKQGGFLSELGRFINTSPTGASAGVSGQDLSGLLGLSSSDAGGGNTGSTQPGLLSPVGSALGSSPVGQFVNTSPNGLTGRITGQDLVDMFSKSKEADPAIAAKSAKQGSQTVESLVAQAKRPTRSKIANNTDEYIGGTGTFEEGWGVPVIPEVDDLASSAIDNAALGGANLDSPETLKDLGMISKSPAEKARDAKSFGQIDSFDALVDQEDAATRDPLNAVMGGGSPIGFSTSPGKATAGDVAGSSAGAKSESEQKINTGSKYGDGPGYGGQTGNGEFGGDQSGSSMGDEKEPGLKKPDYSDSVDPATPQKSAEKYSSFAGSGEKVGLDGSTQGKSGGASIEDEPGPAFSMVSTEGALDCLVQRSILEAKLSTAADNWRAAQSAYDRHVASMHSPWTAQEEAILQDLHEELEWAGFDVRFLQRELNKLPCYPNG